MSDILFGNNNKAIIKKITKRELAADRKRNFFIVAAIFDCFYANLCFQHWHELL